MFAVVAPKAGEAVCQNATGEKLAQFPLDEERQPGATAALARLGEKGLEMLADHTVQNGVLGLPAHVRTTCAPAPSCVHSLKSANRRPIGGDRFSQRILGCRVQAFAPERTPCRCRSVRCAAVRAAIEATSSAYGDGGCCTAGAVLRPAVVKEWRCPGRSRCGGRGDRVPQTPRPSRITGAAQREGRSRERAPFSIPVAGNGNGGQAGTRAAATFRISPASRRSSSYHRWRAPRCSCCLPTRAGSRCGPRRCHRRSQWCAASMDRRRGSLARRWHRCPRR